MSDAAPETPARPRQGTTKPEAGAETTDIAKGVGDKDKRDAMRTALQSRARKALTLAEDHPLGAIAVVTAGAALVQFELAVGILTGIGAGALLSKQNGAEARQRVLAKGKWALDRARGALANRQKAQPLAPPPPAGSAPPPA